MRLPVEERSKSCIDFLQCSVLNFSAIMSDVRSAHVDIQTKLLMRYYIF